MNDDRVRGQAAEGVESGELASGDGVGPFGEVNHERGTGRRGAETLHDRRAERHRPAQDPGQTIEDLAGQPLARRLTERVAPSEPPQQAHGKIGVVERRVPRIVVRHRGRPRQQILESPLPAANRRGHGHGRRHLRLAKMRPEPCSPGVAVGERCALSQRRDGVDLKMIVRVDQSREDEMPRQIDVRRVLRRQHGDLVAREVKGRARRAIGPHDHGAAQAGAGHGVFGGKGSSGSAPRPVR